MTAAGSFTARGEGTVMKILIAEDSATIRRLDVARLIADGYDVVEAADGEEAVVLARREVPHLLILDKVLPKFDGFEDILALRVTPRTHAIHNVIVSNLRIED